MAASNTAGRGRGRGQQVFAPSIISHNIAGGTLVICELINRFKPAVLALQEVTIKTKELNSIVSRLNYIGESNVDPEFPNQRGTALVWRKELVVVGFPRVVVTRRLQLVTLGQAGGQGEALTVVNYYAPTGTAGRVEREELVSGPLTLTLRQLGAGSKFVVTADWNSVTQEMDVEKNFAAKRSEATSRLEQDFTLTDVYRKINPNTLSFTFYRQSVTRSRLDRGYLSPSLAPFLQGATHEPSLGDHAVLKIDLEVEAWPGQVDSGGEGGGLGLGGAPRDTPVLWILNNSILEDTQFRELVAKLWQKLREEQAGYEDIVDWWEEEARPTLRKFCQHYSKMRARARRGRKDWAYLELRGALEEGDWAKVARLREELRVILMFEEQGLKLRSRCKQEIEEERASLYHVGREISSSGRGSITKLKIEKLEGGRVREEVTEDPREIEGALVTFYDGLFNGRLDSNLKDTGQEVVARLDLHQEEFLQGLDRLREESKRKLEERLSEEEVLDNLKAMECGRSPGEDGLTREFYSSLWDTLGCDIVKVLQGTLDRELLPLSNTRGLTRLCSKVLPPAVPRVTETRPITRLNTDYKLLSRCLASRTRAVMPEVIKSRQMALPGRDIMEGGHNILSAISYIEQRHRETGEFGGFVASYDEVKAYDVTRTAYVDLVMDCMNFGPKFRRWCLMLNRGATTRILLPMGRVSREIKLAVSIRQGDPSSLNAFQIQFEPYLRRLDQVLKGVIIGGPRHAASHLSQGQAQAHVEKGPAVVDDVVVTSTDISDLRRVDEVSSRYEKQSGMMLSRSSKSKVMFLGSWKWLVRRPQLPVGVEYLQEVKQLKVLGLTISPNFNKTLQLTWEERISKLKTQCILWSTRSLPTLHQRAQVIGIYLASKIYYHAQVLPLPTKYQMELERQIRRFLYRGKIVMGRLKLEELSQPVSGGGVGLVDLERKCASLYLRQVFRMLSRQESGWLHISYWLQYHLPGFSLRDRPRALTQPPSQHRYMLTKLVSASQGKTENELKGMMTKELYTMLCQDLPEPRLVTRSPELDVRGLVWPRLATTILGVEARFNMFCIVNEILRNREYMFRVWGTGDPSCDRDPDPTGECAGVDQTIPHLLQTCGRVAGAWSWLRRFLFLHLLPPESVSDEELLGLKYPKAGNRDDEVTWLVGSYVEYVVREAVTKGRVVEAEELKAYLGQKLVTHGMRRLKPLCIPGL